MTLKSREEVVFKKKENFREGWAVKKEVKLLPRT